MGSARIYWPLGRSGLLRLTMQRAVRMTAKEVVLKQWDNVPSKAIGLCLVGRGKNFLG